MTTAYILGAGFSKNVGVPIYRDMPAALLREGEREIDRHISDAIRSFLRTAFSWTGEITALPDLEDIFTMIDLSANSGHYLGRDFSPKKLRALRRMLIHRIFRIINVETAATPSWIITFLEDLSPTNSAFVVLNWDIVLENRLSGRVQIDYCCDCREWDGGGLYRPGNNAIKVAKVHGSSNWVYCDNCRTLFFDRHQKLPLHINAALTLDDFSAHGIHLTEAELGGGGRRGCPLCETVVGPHIATFSMRKSFRTHAFASTWFAAEKILSEAEEWVFVGYSFPQADYEFRHILKSCELKSGHHAQRKRMRAVFLDHPAAADRFKTFFGLNDSHVEQGGLEGYLAHMGRD